MAHLGGQGGPIGGGAPEHRLQHAGPYLLEQAGVAGHAAGPEERLALPELAAHAGLSAQVIAREARSTGDERALIAGRAQARVGLVEQALAERYLHEGEQPLREPRIVAMRVRAVDALASG